MSKPDGGDSGLMSKRRAFLAAIGAAGLASVASADVESGGLSTQAIAQQYVREQYTTSPRAVFDPSELEAGELFWVTDDGEIGVWDGSGKVHPGFGSAENPVGDSHFSAVHSESLHGIADHIVRDLDDYHALFPLESDGPSDLSPGDTVFIDPDDPPIRLDGPRHLDGTDRGGQFGGVTVYGRYKYGSEIDLMADDETEASALIINRPEGVTVEGLSYDGNKDNQSHGEPTSFIQVQHGTNLRFGFNYAQNLYPYHVHNAQGDMFNVAQWGNQDGIYGYFNRCDNTGDRMWTLQEADNVCILGDRSSNGFDRTFSLRGVKNAWLLGCRGGDHVEGSFIGVQPTNNRAPQNINIGYCGIEGVHRAFVQIFDPDNNHGAGAVTVTNCTGIKTGQDDLSQERAPVHGGGNGGAGPITVDDCHFEGYEYGVSATHDLTKVSNSHFADIGIEMFHVPDNESPEEIQLGSDVTWENVASIGDLSAADIVRWDGVIGGGPFAGVDLSTATGDYDGDLAVADGTSAASAGAWARWDDGNSQWEYVDPAGTV